jgi:hypothetical protein
LFEKRRVPSDAAWNEESMQTAYGVYLLRRIVNYDEMLWISSGSPKHYNLHSLPA